MTTAAECCDLILFGSLGDLARRKLLPALYQLEKAELFHDDSRIIGVAREALSADDFRERVKQSLKEFVTKEQIDDEVWQRFPVSCIIVLSIWQTWTPTPSSRNW